MLFVSWIMKKALQKDGEHVIYTHINTTAKVYFLTTDTDKCLLGWEFRIVRIVLEYKKILPDRKPLGEITNYFQLFNFLWFNYLIAYSLSTFSVQDHIHSSGKRPFYSSIVSLQTLRASICLQTLTNSACTATSHSSCLLSLRCLVPASLPDPRLSWEAKLRVL